MRRGRLQSLERSSPVEASSDLVLIADKALLLISLLGYDRITAKRMDGIVTDWGNIASDVSKLWEDVPFLGSLGASAPQPILQI